MKNWFQLKQERNNSPMAYFRFRVYDKWADAKARNDERRYCPSSDWAFDTSRNIAAGVE